MIGFRPRADERYLTRPRLLDMLPDESGFVVWLEAPYGYGKSVLASQWATRLEEHGRRTVWLAIAGRDPRQSVAAELGLPAGAPWPAVLDALWSEPTLLVFEDLEGLDDHSELVPLLRDVRGMVLLASRGPLRTSELPRLLTSGRLVHLGPDDLGFTVAEAQELFVDAAAAERFWSRANGWPLPLHFASLTGGLAEGEALLSGMRASLPLEQFDEALLLATLPYLPADSAVDATRGLARSGFVQLGQSGYRLHALVAESLLSAHRLAANAALKRAAGRLPRLLYGEALERIGDLGSLAELLEEPQKQVYRQAPETYLRWDALLGGSASALRHLTAGAAHKVLGNHERAVARLTAALEVGGLAPNDEILALKEFCWSLALVDNEAAVRVIESGEALLDSVDQEWAGRFLSDASFVHAVAGRFDEAAKKLELSLERLPEGSAYRSATLINLALNRWDANGDYLGRLAAQTLTLEEVWRLYPSDAPGQCRDLAMLHAWAGETTTARAYLERALTGERANPLVGLEVRAALAALGGDEGDFAGLLESARAWGKEYTLDIITMYAIDSLPADAPLAAAEQLYRAVLNPGLAVVAYAKRLSGAGSSDEALRLLAQAQAKFTPRAYQVYLLAARFAITREVADLDALLALTNAGARLLPGLVRLSELPRERPELALAYPLAEVLASSWPEACALRLDEVPDLELTLLGDMRLEHMGKVLELTDRQRQLVTLCHLGLSREEVAEAIWPEADQSKQRNNISVQFSLLRRVVEPWGVTTFVHEDGLKRVTSDHARLRVALAAGDAEAVLALYREPFAAGLDLEAVAVHRAWLRERAIAVLSEAVARAGDPEPYLLKVMELDPLNEEALQALLRHLVGRGRAREAQRHYAVFARLVEDELGMEPMPATREVLETGRPATS